MLQATIANVNRDKKVRPYKAEQFIPKWERRQQVEGNGEMSPEEMLRAVKRIHKAMGG